MFISHKFTIIIKLIKSYRRTDSCFQKRALAVEHFVQKPDTATAKKNAHLK